MEEILASIRRIIEDGNPPPGKEADDEELREFRQEFGGEAISGSLQHAGGMSSIPKEAVFDEAAQVIEASFHRVDDDAPPAAKKSKAKEAAPMEAPAAETPMKVEAPLERKEEQTEEKVMAAVERVELHQDDFAAPEPVAETPFERQLRPILSDMAGRQVSAAFSDLTNAIEKERQQSLAAIAEDMIRPMLQEWLDNNLPTMVERLVREEIERVSRSGRA